MKIVPPLAIPPSPISAVISKVQCQWQKRIKEWCHQGGYKQWVRCVPFRMANSDVIKCHQYQLRPCVCAELQESSIPRLSWSFAKYGLTQLCMLTQDKSTKSEESYIYSGQGCNWGWLGQKCQPRSVASHSDPLLSTPNFYISLIVTVFPRGGGTLGISGWGCAARTLEPLT